MRSKIILLGIWGTLATAVIWANSEPYIIGFTGSDNIEIDGHRVPGGTTILSEASIYSPNLSLIHLRNGQTLLLDANTRARLKRTSSAEITLSIDSGQAIEWNEATGYKRISAPASGALPAKTQAPRREKAQPDEKDQTTGSHRRTLITAALLGSIAGLALEEAAASPVTPERGILAGGTIGAIATRKKKTTPYDEAIKQQRQRIHRLKARMRSLENEKKRLERRGKDTDNVKTRIRELEAELQAAEDRLLDLKLKREAYRKKKVPAD